MTNQHSLISIIIVNWKTPKLLAQCLTAVLADSNSAKFEIWVVDNASGDQSVAMLNQGFPQVRVIVNKENLGFPKACNQAITQAQGKYILLLNPDTFVVENAISKLAKFMDQHSDCGAVGPKILNPDGSLQLACRRSFPDPVAAFFRVTYLSKLFPQVPLFAKYNLTYKDPNILIEVDGLSGSCMMVRKAAIDLIGVLDEEWFMYGEELDWCWRIKQGGWKIIYNPEAVIYHYHGAASQLRPLKSTIYLHHGLMLFYKKHIAPNEPLLFNWLIYAAIWARAVLFIVLAIVSRPVVGQRQDIDTVINSKDIIKPRA